MPKRSAGLLAYRRTDDGIEVLLVHPGGPYWARKDDGAWSLPKGEIDDPGEDPFAVAVREFGEELGVDPPDVADALDLGEVRQPGGKYVQAWAVEGDVDVSDVRSNMFELEWPPRSGRTEEFPEVDRAGWFGSDDARRKILRGQTPFLDRLQTHLDGG
jgi:predicted NUDIX family NTP pyrophosphohydrolase